MIEIPRVALRQFRAVLRRTLADQQPRGSWPLVLCRTDKESLMLEAVCEEVAVRYRPEGGGAPAAVAFRASALAELEGPSSEPVALEAVAPDKGRARWTDAGVPRVLELETVATESVPAFPALPRRLTAMPATFLTALDQAARTTASEIGRLAMSRVQLRGQTGELIATDGKQLLAQGGFALPWTDDVLVPRLASCGCRELADEDGVHIGRTSSHVVLGVGLWTFALAIDKTSKYPDVATAVPRTTAATSRLRIDPEDATFLTTALPRLPGRNDDHAAITLDLGAAVVIRARDGSDGAITEVVLARSTATGPPLCLCTARAYLLRALKLGFTEFLFAGPDKPVVSRRDKNTFVWMLLDEKSALASGPDTLRIASNGEAVPASSSTSPIRKAPMPASAPNGQQAPPGQPSNAPPERWGIVEVIAEAEALRALLQDAAGRTARLLAALKQQRRQSRAVQQAMASLRELQLEA